MSDAASIQRDGPSLFVGITLEVEEIIIGRNVMNTKVATIREAMDKRHEATLKQAAEELAVIAGQMQTLSAHLASVIGRHQRRLSKIPE